MQRRAKYNAHPVDADGYHFDSLAEERRYRELRLLERNGDIEDLKVHPRFEIMPALNIKGKHYRPTFYEGDFAYTENGVDVVEDVKGVQTDVFKLKWKMMWMRYPLLDLRIVLVNP